MSLFVEIFDQNYSQSVLPHLFLPKELETCIGNQNRHLETTKVGVGDPTPKLVVQDTNCTHRVIYSLLIKEAKPKADKPNYTSPQGKIRSINLCFVPNLTSVCAVVHVLKSKPFHEGENNEDI